MIVANDCLILRIFQMGDAARREEVLMDVINHQQAAREAEWMLANRKELVERIGQAMRADGTAQPLPGLHLYRHSLPLEQVYSVVEPSVCVVAQGSKEFLLGESRYRYDPFHYLLVTVDLPYVGQVLEASPERPFLSLRLDLPPSLVGEVMVEAGHSSRRDPTDRRAIAVSPVDGHLLDAMVRVARLLDAPDEARVLLPLLTREMAAPGGPSSDAGRRLRRGQCRLSRGLPGRLPLQSGVQKPLRCPTHARRATPAGSRLRFPWPMSQKITPDESRSIVKYIFSVQGWEA